MSKNKFAFILLPVGAAMIFLFQNCTAGFVSDSESSFGAIEVNQSPMDSVSGVPTGFLPVLGDRYYMTSVLTNAFGPTTSTVDTSKTSTNASDYGSSCSPYEDYNVMVNGVLKRADPMAQCLSASFQTLTLPDSYQYALVNPQGTTTRAANLTHACSDLTTNNTTLAYALSQISSDPVPAATAANIQKMFQLFYQNHPAPPADLVSSIQQIFTATPTTDQWRVAIYSICSSQYWQIL